MGQTKKSSKVSDSLVKEIRKIGKRLGNIEKIELAAIAKDLLRLGKGKKAQAKESLQLYAIVKDLLKVGKSLNKEKIEALGNEGLNMLLKLQPKLEKEWNKIKKDIDKELLKVEGLFKKLRTSMKKHNRKTTRTRKRKTKRKVGKKK